MGLFKKMIIAVYRVLPKWLSEPIVRLVAAKHTVGVVGVVFNKEGLVLVLHHTYDEPIRLPGGHLEYGEAPYDTIRREMLEEANCSVEPVGILGFLQLKRKKFDIFLIGMLVQEFAFTANEEITAKEWYDPADVDKLALLPAAHQEFVKKACVWLEHNKE